MSRVRVCARCGSKPREGDLFICTECREDPQTAREIYEAAGVKGEGDGTAARRAYLVETFRWHGWR